MADWYVSSASWFALPQFAISTLYTVGQIIRPLATPAAGHEFALRCTVGGTSAATEPVWPAGNNATVVSGGATFANVSGQSTYGWGAAAGTLYSMSNGIFARTAAGDRIFVASDHSENLSLSSIYSFGAAGFGLIQVISVNRAGSVPPVAADVQSGAAITDTISGVQNMSLDPLVDMFWQGITFTVAGAASTNAVLSLSGSGRKSHYFKNCALVITATGAGGVIGNNSVGIAKATLDNTTMQFSMAAQFVGPLGGGPLDLTWINTPSAIQGATIPTNLFNIGGAGESLITCRGIDISAVTGTLAAAGISASVKLLLDSCRIVSGVTRLLVSTTTSCSSDEVELVNCFDGTNVLNERHTAAGDLTTDRSTTLNGGAADDVGAYSFKLVSSSRSDKLSFPLDSFWFDVENTVIGVSKTATVEVLSLSSLNNDDISLLLEYMGTSGSSVASFASSLPANVLTAGSALPNSSATWSSSLAVAWNPIDSANTTFSNSNLTATGTNNGGCRADTPATTGKFYWEFTFVSGNVTPMLAGYGLASINFSSFGSGNTTGATTVAKAGNINVNNANPTGNPSLGVRANGDIIGVAIDIAAKLIWFRVAPSGNWNGSGTANPVTGTGGVDITSIVTGPLYPIEGINGVGAITANFGASAFTGAVPSGFVSGFSPPPVKQLLQVTFTPQVAGRLRGLVKLGKPSIPVWVNPQIAVT